jgi:hypothetical protein
MAKKCHEKLSWEDGNEEGLYLDTYLYLAWTAACTINLGSFQNWNRHTLCCPWQTSCENFGQILGWPVRGLASGGQKVWGTWYEEFLASTWL